SHQHRERTHRRSRITRITLIPTSPNAQILRNIRSTNSRPTKGNPMTDQIPVTDGLSITAPSWWSRDGIGGHRVKGSRICEGRGFSFIADEEILPLATALADYLANNN